MVVDWIQRHLRILHLLEQIEKNLRHIFLPDKIDIQYFN